MAWKRILPLILGLGFVLWMFVKSDEPDSSVASESVGPNDPLPELEAEDRTLVAPTTARVEVSAPIETVAAESELTEEVIFEEIWEEEAVEDPIERGTCGLFVRAIWQSSGLPAASHFQLYRINAPENEFYTAGDQLQLEGQLPKEGKQILYLAEGEYRVTCWAASAKTPDPPSFFVAGDQTEALLELTAPPAGEAHLLLYDEHGTRLENVDRYGIRYESGTELGPELPWLNARMPKKGYTVTEGFMDAFESGNPPVEHLVAVDKGFFLTPVKGATKYHFNRSRHSLGLPDHTAVVVPVAWEGEGPPTWVGVIVPLERIAAALWLEYGDRPDPAKLTLDAQCIARPLAELPDFEPWSVVAIQVNVDYPGHKTLEFAWSPGQGLLEDQFLQVVD